MKLCCKQKAGENDHQELRIISLTHRKSEDIKQDKHRIMFSAKEKTRESKLQTNARKKPLSNAQNQKMSF